MFRTILPSVPHPGIHTLGVVQFVSSWQFSNFACKIRNLLWLFWHSPTLLCCGEISGKVLGTNLWRVAFLVWILHGRKGCRTREEKIIFSPACQLFSEKQFLFQGVSIFLSSIPFLCEVNFDFQVPVCREDHCTQIVYSSRTPERDIRQSGIKNGLVFRSDLCS